MNDKVKTWVILRLDGPSAGLEDYIAVKGVYDTHEEAVAAMERVSHGSRSAQYTLVQSRRYVGSQVSEQQNTKAQVQGFDVSSRTQDDGPDNESAFAWIRNLWLQLPSDVRKHTVLPLISKLAEYAVAKALDGQVTNSNMPWDVELSDRTRIEVKTIILDETKKRAPSVQFRPELPFDALALVVFRPDLSIEAARLIPASALDLFVRPDHNDTGNQRFVSLRVTPHILNFVGTTDIPIVRTLGEPVTKEKTGTQ